MSEERDLLDGGFAVVDREKIIEEETREITPWYKHFINIFIDPRKMMEENFYHEPPKGMGVASLGTILFTTLLILLNFANPIIKKTAYDAYRMAGIGEEFIAQKYAMSQVGGVIGGVIAVFLGALFTAVALQVAKAIVKDKGRFGSLYTLGLLSQMVSAALLCVDKCIAYFIPTDSMVLGLSILFSQEMLKANVVLNVILALFSLPSIATLIILVIGYSVITRASTKKSVAVIIGVQIFFTLISIGLALIGQMFMQQAGIAF